MRHLLVTNVHGVFERVSGTVRFDAAAPEATEIRVEIVAFAERHPQVLLDFRLTNQHTNLVEEGSGSTTPPAKRNGGYCLQASAGDPAWSYFVTW